MKSTLSSTLCPNKPHDAPEEFTKPHDAAKNRILFFQALSQYLTSAAVSPSTSRVGAVGGEYEMNVDDGKRLPYMPGSIKRNRQVATLQIRQRANATPLGQWH
jgi:hypothetical protein